MTRRLFERLQQRVRCRGAEHVHLVDEVHLRLRRRADAEAHPLDEVTNRVDAVVRRGVHLDEVVEVAGRDRDAVLARAVRLAVRAEVQAVERLGQDAGGRGLARAPRSREEVGVADPALAHGVAQRRGDVLLADQLAETLGSVLAVERLEGHVPTLEEPERSRRPVAANADRAPAVDPTPMGAEFASGSDQATLRHTGGPAESCFLPDLTRFTRSRCAGPDHLHLRRVAFPTAARASNGDSAPHNVDLGYRAPRAPRLARSAGAGYQGLRLYHPRLPPPAAATCRGRTRRDARAAESARLESVCGATHRGFESHSLRQSVTALFSLGVRWRSSGNTAFMYIGGGVLVLILIILVVVLLMRR